MLRPGLATWIGVSAISKSGRGRKGPVGANGPEPVMPLPYTKPDLVSMSNRSAGTTLHQKGLTITKITMPIIKKVGISLAIL